jgi:hypothetical protein
MLTDTSPKTARLTEDGIQVKKGVYLSNVRPRFERLHGAAHFA